jgi:UDP-galactopyranose mutase
MAQRKIAVVGAGLSGATIAYHLARWGREVVVFDQREHIAGNVHTYRDPETGVMVHAYGPHVFHTDDEDTWKFMSRFTTFIPYVQRTKGIHDGRVYSLPINLHTINQFYNESFSPAEARRFLDARCEPWNDPDNFEDQALQTVGRDLYEAFLRTYTTKQWGLHPARVPASILKRLPLRLNYNDNAFAHKYQGIPKDGYTKAVGYMLDHPNVRIELGTKFRRANADRFDHVFYSGPIDGWFDYAHGYLPYRTLDFERIRADGDLQGCAVLNSCDYGHNWTRSTEHKHFTPWERHGATIVYREYPRDCGPGDTPYYPMRFPRDKELLAQYEALAAREENVTFVGRLGTYQYLDMDVTVKRALDVVFNFRVS